MTTPLPANITGIQVYGLYLNSVSDGWFGSITLLGIFIVMMFLLKRKTQETNFAVSSLITLMLGAGFAAMDWVTMKVLLIAFALAVVGFFLIRARENPGY